MNEEKLNQVGVYTPQSNPLFPPPLPPPLPPTKLRRKMKKCVSIFSCYSKMDSGERIQLQILFSFSISVELARD
jgi:hypothetical protein